MTQLFINVAVIGDDRTGKSRLITRLVDGQYDESVRVVNLHTKRWDTRAKGVEMTLRISDEGSSGMYVPIKCSLKHAHAALVLFDITNEKSFIWAQRAIQVMQNDPPACLRAGCLVGTKTDLHLDRGVDHQTVRAYAASLDIPYLEVSAKEGINVQECFEVLADQLADALQEVELLPETKPEIVSEHAHASRCQIL